MSRDRLGPFPTTSIRRDGKMSRSSTAMESHEAVRIFANSAILRGDLRSPPAPSGAVLFAHGSGSGRHSPRNQFVAERLRDRGLATLLFDLLTAAEEASDRRTGHLRFDIPFLADRLAGALGWLAADGRTAGLPVGLFGASTGG